MEVERYEDGVPSWVDLGCDDLSAAKDFYRGLFGWNTPEGPPEAGGYAVCDLGGKTVAGLGPNMNPTAPPHWSTYVNGGTVFMPPMDVMEAGRMAVFADPTGAVIGLWQPKEHMGAQLVNEPGTYCWSELMTDDVEGSKAFYRAVFGWEAETQGPAGPAAYTEWKVGERSVGGMMAKPEQMPAGTPSFWGVYFAVADTDASVTRAKELGASVMMEPMDIEPGRFAVLTDPVGAMFNVLALKSELQA
jgi:uncharacterized protein